MSNKTDEIKGLDMGMLNFILYSTSYHTLTIYTNLIGLYDAHGQRMIVRN